MDPRDVLKSIYLFRDITPDDLAALADITERKSYMVEEYLYRTGDIPDVFFVVESGTIDVIIKDKEHPVATVGTGQALGEMAFFERSARVASAITREPTHVLQLPFAKLDELFSARPKLAAAFYQRCCVFFARLLRTLAPDVNRRYF